MSIDLRCQVEPENVSGNRQKGSDRVRGRTLLTLVGLPG